MNPALMMLLRGAQAAGLTATYASSVGNGTDGPTITFAGLSLGTESSARTIVIATAGWASGGVAVTGVTVAGESATIDHTAAGVGFAHLALPSGTTGDVVVTWSGTGYPIRSGVVVIVVNGPVSVSASLSLLSSYTITGAAGGFILGAGIGPSSYSWTNATEVCEEFTESGGGTPYYFSAALSTAEGSTTIGATNNVSGVVAYQPA